MIFRPRSKVGSPAVLANRNSLAASERQLAKAYYSSIPPPTASYTFARYKHEDVRAALQKLFGTKCAYCEIEAAGAPTHIEHYRPKGGVHPDGQAIAKLGYWWLASTWRNLLISCAFCNTVNTHDNDAGTTAVLGKANKFPLGAPTVRATRPTEVRREKPLLLDPTVDDPRNHIRFEVVVGLDRRLECVVRPVVRNGVEDQRGRATIDTVGLRREELNRLRGDRIKSLRSLLEVIEDDIRGKQAAHPGYQPQELSTLSKKKIQEVAEDYLDWKRPFAAACRTEVKAWKARMRALAYGP